MIATIKTTARVYQEENGAKGCTIWGTSVSLGAVLYAFAIQEGGRKDGTVGERTNNWGSLHKAQWVKVTNGVIHADNTGTRPVYKTPEDGLYEKASLLTKWYNNCNLTERSVKCYVKWCNGKVDAKWQEYISALYNNLKKNAKEYDNLYNDSIVYPTVASTSTPVKNVSSENFIEDDTKRCWKIKTIRKSDYIQADYGNDTRTMNIDDMSGDYIRLYSCFNK